MTHTSTASDDYARESAERGLLADLRERNLRYCEQRGLLPANSVMPKPITCTQPITLADAMRMVDERRE